jgi:hypothetical protein
MYAISPMEQATGAASASLIIENGSNCISPRTIYGGFKVFSSGKETIQAH